MHIPACIANLILRYMRGELSTAESGKLQEWVNSADENSALLNELMNEDILNDELHEFENGKRSAWEKINEQILSGRKVK